MFGNALRCAVLTPDNTGLLVCDSSNHIVRLLNFTTQNVTIVAGARCMHAAVLATLSQPRAMLGCHSVFTLLLYGSAFLGLAGLPGSLGDSTGSVDTALLDNPVGATLTPWGDTYIVLSGSRNIKRVRAGVVSTVAGSPGSASPPQDGPALNATLGNAVRGVFGLPGRVWFVDGNRIRVFSFPGQMPPGPPAPPRPPMPPVPGPPGPPFGACGYDGRPWRGSSMCSRQS